MLTQNVLAPYRFEYASLAVVSNGQASLHTVAQEMSKP